MKEMHSWHRDATSTTSTTNDHCYETNRPEPVLRRGEGGEGRYCFGALEPNLCRNKSFPIPPAEVSTA